MSEKIARELVEGAGGTVDETERLPDGSGFMTASFPLPENHWLYRKGANVPPMPLRAGEGALGIEFVVIERTGEIRREVFSRSKLREVIREAGRYAMRCATNNGVIEDSDPDAFVQNLLVGLLGYNGSDDALSPEHWQNPGKEGDAERKRLAEQFDDPTWIAADLSDA